MTAPIAPDERAAVAEYLRQFDRLRDTGGLIHSVHTDPDSDGADLMARDLQCLLDALDAAEAERDEARAATSPVWDEDTVTEAARRAVAGVVVNVSNWPDGVQTRMLGRDLSAPIDAITSAVLAVVREYAPVRPDREAVARAIYAQEAQPIYDEMSEQRVGSRPWDWITEEHRDHYLSRADEIINLWPGESRATVQAEALHDAAEEIDRLDFGPDQDRPFSTGARHKWGAMRAAARVRARANRLEKGADRG